MSKCPVCTLMSVLAAAGIGFVPADADAQITFSKIADFNTPIPGGGGTFDSLSAPSLADGDIAFYGGGDPMEPCAGEGIYLYRDNALRLVADNCTQMPGCPPGMFFVGFSQPALGAGHVSFTGFADYMRYYCRGIYDWHQDSGLTVLVDPSTEDPGGYGYLYDYFTVSRDDPAIGFTAWTSWATHGVYVTTNPGDVALVANYDTPIPGGSGTFSAFGFNVTVGEGTVAFTGGTWDSLQWGLYTGPPGPRLVADRNTPIPGGVGTFTDFGDRPSIDGGYVAFYGEQTGGQSIQKGIYTNLGGTLRVVVDLNTEIPGTNLTFTDFTMFYGPGIDNGQVALRGEGPGEHVGIYCEINGRLIKVVDLDTPLEAGLTLQNLSIDEQCLDGNRLGFYASFDTGVPGEHLGGIYVAELPSGGVIPAVSGWGLVAMTLLVLAAAMILVRRRHPTVC